jgi:hypothetical protein
MWKKLLIAFVMLVVVLWLSLDFILKRYVENEIKVWTENPESPYDIQYEKLKIEIFKGRVAIRNLEIHYKSSVYDSLIQIGELPTYTYAVELAFMQAEVPNWMELLFKRRLIVDHIILNSPSITRYRQTKAKITEPSEKQDSIALKTFREFLNYFSLDSISIQNAAVSQTSVGTDSIENFAIDNIYFTLSDLSLTSKDFDEDGGFVLPDFEWAMENIHVRLSKSNHAYIEKVMVRNDKLYLLKVALTNDTPYHEFITRQKWRKVHIEMTADSISVDISRILEYFFTDRLLIPSISVSGLNMNLAVNPNKDFENSNRPLLSKRIREIKFPLTIDTLSIDHSRIDLKLLLTEDRAPGLLTFDRINATVLNLTNDPENLKKDPWMLVHVTARNQRQGLVEVNFAFNIADKRDSFKAKGRIEAIDFAKFNAITKEPMDMSFENGHLYRLSFDIKGNNDSAHGIVHFDYEDLQVLLLKATDKEVDSKGHFLKKVMSGILNGLLKTENLVEKKNYKYAIVDIEKGLNKGQMGFILDVISDGIIQITTRRGELSDSSPKEIRREKRRLKKEEKQKDN